ncbi:MAG: acetyl-CoA synthase subunit gamma [Chloroflexi bacterium]|nr:acetyl-CoA synthase subunit gamma [Chloroflexota bacterium]
MTPKGNVPQVATSLQLIDRVGSFKARWNIGRMNYSVEPGLYAVGTPSPESPALVSANYKMSFDRLRSELTGRDLWVLVLDTQGINVWCAAGKGTFGTDELVRQIQATRLREMVSHRTLILPQLGAPGVAAHQVERRTGFRVVYGPVRASDLPALLDAGMKATPEMRRVRFTTKDRLALTPIELVLGFQYILAAAIVLPLLGGWGRDGYALVNVSSVGLRAVLLFLVGYLGGALITPLFLPWLPGRAFAMKGALVGLFLAAGTVALGWETPLSLSQGLNLLAWSMLLPATSAFFAMNFTGASTYTSLSGVRKEVHVALPLQLAAVGTGLVLWMVSHFV